MNSKFDFLNLTESERILNLTNENSNRSFSEPYIPIQTENYLSVRIILIIINHFSL